MRPEDFEILKQLVGKTVKEIRANTEDESDYGFDIVFDDGTVLEIYDLKCAKLDEGCYGKEVEVYKYDLSKDTPVSKEKTADLPVGGGVAWAIMSEELEEVDSDV